MKKNLRAEILWKKRFVWIGRKILKMLNAFIFCFFVAAAVDSIFSPGMYSFPEYCINLITLRMPGSTTWYFKIQILLYIFLWIVVGFAEERRIPKKRTWLYVGILSAAYVVIAVLTGLADYWWKTATCFATGIMVADYKDKIAVWTNKHRWLTVAASSAAALIGSAYVLLAAHGYQPVLQSVAFCMISVGGCIAVTMLRPNTKTVFHWFAGFTLELYLIHIGILKAIVYGGCLDLKIAMYILISIGSAWAVKKIISRVMVSK